MGLGSKREGRRRAGPAAPGAGGWGGKGDQNGCGMERRETLSHPNRSPGTPRRPAAARGGLGISLEASFPPPPPPEPGRGARRRPPAFVTGSVHGRELPRWALFWRSRVGPLAPPRPRPPRAGDGGGGDRAPGTGTRGASAGASEPVISSCAPFVIELFSFGAGAGRRRRKGSGKGAPALGQPQRRAQVPAHSHCVRVGTAGGMRVSRKEGSRRGSAPGSSFLAAAGRLGSAPGSPLRSALEVLGGRAWALWTHPGSGGCPRGARRFPGRRGLWLGTKRQTAGASGGRAHTGSRRAATEGTSPGAPALRSPGALRLETSQRPAPSSQPCI